jgi:hypothetical protein
MMHHLGEYGKRVWSMKPLVSIQLVMPTSRESSFHEDLEPFQLEKIFSKMGFVQNVVLPVISRVPEVVSVIVDGNMKEQ